MKCFYIYVFMDFMKSIGVACETDNNNLWCISGLAGEYGVGGGIGGGGQAVR